MISWCSILLDYLSYEISAESLVDWALANHNDVPWFGDLYWDEVFDYVADEIRCEYPSMPSKVWWRAAAIMACFVTDFMPTRAYEYLGESAEEYLRQMLITPKKETA